MNAMPRGQSKSNPPAKQARSRLTPKMIERQFKPGQSGNPAGRPKYKTLSESVRKLLEMPANKNQKNGPTLAEVIADAVLKKARKGDVKAFEAVANRAEGKPSQPVELSGGVLVETPETRREWAEKKLIDLMKSHRLSRANAIKELKATGATKLLELLGEA